MKLLKFTGVALFALSLSSCGGMSQALKQTMVAVFAPEEQGLNITKITDENSHEVLRPVVQKGAMFSSFAMSTWAGTKDLQWGSGRYLAISPDGTELAYLSSINDQPNIMIRKATAAGASTQRTFRRVNDFAWGPDDKLYYSDISSTNNSEIATTNAHSGALMTQLTKQNYDFNPSLSPDGKKLYFTRIDQAGPAIWCLGLKDGTLTMCARGFNPTPVNSTSFLCTRNSTAGVSEIWLVDYVKGMETLILTNKEKGFSCPSISPDGKWILCQGTSNYQGVKNVDIYAVRIDGSEMVQLTYHPGHDLCPTWSADGKSVFFMSNRANLNQKYNIWKMQFILE